MKVQEYLEKNYCSKKARKNIKKLNISQQNLEGDLDLSEFENLKILDCSRNNLVGLELKKNNCLEKIICSENKLVKLSLSENNPNLSCLDCSRNDLSDLESITATKFPQKLLYLNLRDNHFSTNKLDIFAKFSQAEELYLGTTDLFRITFGTYNQFYGSLKPLAELKSLRVLCINNTEVNRGWEYLPESVEELFIADTREKLTGEDLGIGEILGEIVFHNNSVREWIESRKVKRNSLEKDLKVFQRLTNMWKEKYEKTKQELENKTIELEKLQNDLEDLQIENSNYQIANGLIREKYERMREKNSQEKTNFEYNSVIQVPPK